MKTTFALLCAVLLTAISSCSGKVSSFSTSTPEEFGNTLFNIVKAKDSVAFQKLIATNEEMIKFLEASEVYKKASSEQQALSLAFIGVALKDTKEKKEVEKTIQWIHNKSQRLEIESWENARVIEIKKGETRDKNVFWINTFIEIAGKQYCIGCQNVLLIPEKGFRFGLRELKFYECDPIKSK